MHPRSDPLLGGGQEVGSINVTTLTFTRMRDILMHPSLKTMSVVLLQEVRLASTKPPWLIRLCAKHGWGIAVAEHTLLDATGKRLAPGGTAVIWRREVGRVTVLRNKELGHSVIGLMTANSLYVSAYGPQRGDAKWFEDLLDWIQSFGRDAVLAGDLNWKKHYEKILSPGWLEGQLGEPTTTAGTHPSRCLAWGPSEPKAPVQPKVDFVAGIPHHGLVTYTCQTNEVRRQLQR